MESENIALIEFQEKKLFGYGRTQNVIKRVKLNHKLTDYNIEEYECAKKTQVTPSSSEPLRKNESRCINKQKTCNTDRKKNIIVNSINITSNQ